MEEQFRPKETVGSSNLSRGTTEHAVWSGAFLSRGMASAVDVPHVGLVVPVTAHADPLGERVEVRDFVGG